VNGCVLDCVSLKQGQQSLMKSRPNRLLKLSVSSAHFNAVQPQLQAHFHGCTESCDSLSVFVLSLYLLIVAILWHSLQLPTGRLYTEISEIFS